MSGAKGKKKDSDVDLTYLKDEKLAKGKKKFAEEGLTQLKGGNHKQRQEDEKESKRLLKKVAAKQAAPKASWKKRAGGICALFFLCGVGLFQFLSTLFGVILGDGVVVVDAADTAKLKSVLFSGEPWLVYCVNDQTQNQRLPKVLEDSARSLYSKLGMQVATLRCWDKTDSGRSVAERFKFKSSPPLSFVVANGNKPKKLDFVGIANTGELEKKVAPALKVETHTINTLKKWSTHCSSRRTCIVVGHKKNAQRDTAVNTLRPLLEQHRGVRVVTLDTSFWQLKLNDGVLETRAKKGGADILCLARVDGKGGGNATYSGRFMQELGVSQAKDFLKACEKQEDLIPLGEPPRIKARPTKPKKAEPAPMPPPPRAASAGSSPSPQPPKGNVDRVGSRETLENEEPLFEAVDEEEEGDMAGDGEDDDGDEEGDEVEL